MREITGPVVHNTTPALARSWHVVATSHEVGSQPVRVWLLGQPWCLARLDDGRVAAWSDRCPHRLAPLSAGKLCGGELQCGYHGWTFAPDGRCTSIPATAQEVPPARARVEVPWAVDECYGLVWMAPQAPLCERHPFPEWDQEGFVNATSEVVRTGVGAALLVDNFLDAAHFPYVHASSFGVPEAAEVRDGGITRDGMTVETVFETWYRERSRVQRQLLRKTGSASLSVKLRLEFPETGAVIAILFCCTPERAGASRVYKLLARNDIAGDPLAVAAFVAEEDQILREDLRILELYDHEELPLSRTVEMHTRADRLSLAWRSLLADAVAPADAVARVDAGRRLDQPR